MPSTWIHFKKKEREREKAMKTNTIQIIRILCLRPALMPSRNFPAGIGAKPDPQKDELAKTKAALHPGFSQSPSTACPLMLQAVRLKLSPSPTSWVTLQSSDSSGESGPWWTAGLSSGRANSVVPKEAAKLGAWALVPPAL